MKKVVAALLLATPLLAQRQSGSPLDHLPPNVEMTTTSGSEPIFLQTINTIAFMDKSFGDASCD